MRRRAHGFTLVEVLVALAIVAIGLVAALRASGIGIDGRHEYRARLLAMWLADNIVSERTALAQWPAPGEQESEAEMAGQRFLVRQEVRVTPNPNFRRLEVSIASLEEPGRELRRLSAFFIKPN